MAGREDLEYMLLLSVLVLLLGWCMVFLSGGLVSPEKCG